MKKCINRLEKKDMNFLISAMGSYDDSASFWTNFIFLKKNLFLRFFHLAVDTSDDAKV